MKRRQLSWILPVLTIGVIFCAPLSQAWILGDWITYTTENSSLPSDDVRAICMDGNGVMWFGTAGGLSKFDGSSWTTYTTADSLVNNMVNVIMYEADPGGDKIWVGTDGGVQAIEITSGAVSFIPPYTTTNAEYPGLLSDKIYSAAVDTQHVRWFGTDKGLMSFDGEQWKSYTAEDTTAQKLAENHVYAIAYETTAYGPEIWVGTGDGISAVSTKIDAVSFATPYTTRNTEYPGMISDMILAAAVDTKNVKWFGTDKGVIRFDGNSFKSYTTRNFLSDSTVTSIAVDKNNLIYFGTQGGGVSRFDGVTSASPIDTEWSNIASDNIRGIAIGLHGAIWFATDKGVTRFVSGDTEVQETTAFPLAPSINGIYPNPFNPSTTIDFSLPTDSRVVLTVFNITGQEIATLIHEKMPAGRHSVVWNAAGMPSGIYFCTVKAGNFAETRKMLLLK